MMWTATLLTVLTFGLVSSYIEGPADRQMLLKPRYYCGRELAGILSALCYDQDFDKRGNFDGFNSLVPASYKNQLQDFERETLKDWPWLSVHKARALAPNNARNKRFVVNECCEKACTIAELLTYC